MREFQVIIDYGSETWERAGWKNKIEGSASFVELFSFKDLNIRNYGRGGKLSMI